MRFGKYELFLENIESLHRLGYERCHCSHFITSPVIELVGRDLEDSFYKIKKRLIDGLENLEFEDLEVHDNVRITRGRVFMELPGIGLKESNMGELSQRELLD